MTRQKGRAGVGRLRADLLERDKARRSRRAEMVEAASAKVARRNDLLPGLHLVDRPPQALRAPARNVRALDPAHVRAVMNSIATLGFSIPVIIDAEGVIIDGVASVEAAKHLALPTVPCVVAEHLTPQERRLLRLAANKLTESGSWSLPELKLELEELIVEDAPIEIVGFGADEIDQILSADDETGLEQGALEPPSDAVAVARPGDLFELGPHRLICGDATDPAVIGRVMQDLGEARLVLTDQPYNVSIKGHVVTGGTHREFVAGSGEMSDEQFAAFTRRYIEAVLPHLCDGGVFGTFIDWRGWPVVQAAAMATALTPLNLIVWSKTNAGMGSLYRSKHELLPLFRKGTAPIINNVGLGRKGRWRSNVWTYPGASSLGSDARKGLQEHPTVKPTAMLEDALIDLTARGDIVIDPFLGSGSTLIAAERCGRVCCGVELDPLYVDVICRRFEAVTGKPAMHVETALPFDELAAARATEAELRQDG